MFVNVFFVVRNRTYAAIHDQLFLVFCMYAHVCGDTTYACVTYVGIWCLLAVRNRTLLTSACTDVNSML